MVPDFVRLGFTAEIPLPNQGFPAPFLVGVRRILLGHGQRCHLLSRHRTGQRIGDTEVTLFDLKVPAHLIRAYRHDHAART